MTMTLKGIETLAKELQNRDMKVVICETFFYLLIISMAIAGNSCVLLAVYRNSRLRTIPNYYIVSLAISDILLPLLCAPYSVAVAIVGRWPFNDSVCQIQGFFVMILACASLLILTLTAINRFFRMVVTKHYRHIFTKWKTIIMIAFGVGLAFLEPLPYLLTGRHYVFHPGKLFCFQTAEISLPNFIVYFYVGLPTSALSVCYALVFRKMRIHQRTVHNLRSSSLAADNISQADVRVTKILFITVIGFLACWTPIAVIDFVDTFRGGTWKYGDSDVIHGVYGPDAWGNVASSCRLADQSPINIATKTVESDSSLGELDITCDNEEGLFNGILLNNGYEPILTADYERGTCNLTGVPVINKNFQLHDLNIHFGCEADRGSEHTIDGKSFPAELQLMFYNTEYGFYDNAASKKDGLAAISVLLKVGKTENNALDSIVDQLDDVAVEGSSIPVYTPADNLTLANLVPDLAKEHAPYYTYMGSLTTPPCYETVKWIVMKNPVTITKHQLEAFKKLTSGQGSECDNFRPTKPVNGRKVEANF